MFSWRRIASILALILIVLAFIFADTLIFYGWLLFQPDPWDKSTEMIEMRDGVKLATNLYIIDSDTPLPTVLVRTPYDKDGAMGKAERMSGFLYELQWHIVVQDTRGRFASEGVDRIFANDSTDAYDTMQWISSQGWSNGKVVTMGGSAVGITQYLQPLSSPPWLEAQYVVVGSADVYRTAFPGGAYRESLFDNWSEIQENEQYLRDEIYHNEQLSSFWDSRRLTPHYDRVGAPAIHLSGWYDIFVQDTIEAFRGYQYQSKPGAQGNSVLIVGPWDHSLTPPREGVLDFPESADTFPVDLNDLVVNFFNSEVYQTGEMDQYSPVYLYVMGPKGGEGNYWLELDDLPATTPLNLYLGSDLSAEISASSTSYMYDPRHLVPTTGGTNLFMPSGPLDQRYIEVREDVVTFTTAPLDQSISICGESQLNLFVSSNATDTDFMVRLVDVFPSGKSALIQEGVQRMRLRNRTEPQFMSPRKVYPISIDIWSTSYVFNPGHAIRVSISSSNAPRYSVNHNDGSFLNEDSIDFMANNTIYHNSSYPSHLVLPIADLSRDMEPELALNTSQSSTTRSSCKNIAYWLMYYTSRLDPFVLC